LICERSIEACQEDPATVPRHLAGPFHGQERLACARPPTDNASTDAPKATQRGDLTLRELDQRAFGSSDIGLQAATKAGGRSEHRGNLFEPGAEKVRRVSLPPVIHHARYGLARREQIGIIDHDLSGLSSDGADDCHVGEHDRMRDPRDGGKAGLELPEEVQQRVFRVHRLPKGILDREGGSVPVDRRPPASLYADSAALDLQHENPISRVQKNEVRFAVALAPTSDCLPCHGREDPPLVIEGCERLPYLAL
jgi:hypothetical protein